jgi:sigma-B regulation protein RsbU (phosphoserine phosphatase)
MMSSERPAVLGDLLLVDDMPANLRLLSQMLSERGYRVRAVTSGSRALAAAGAAPPDLILLDIKMPQLDGYEVCKRLKEEPQTRDIPIIFLSALDQTEDKVKAFAAGGVDYITKPFQMEEVLARVQTHLALRALQKQLQDANRRFAEELDLAGRIQASFLPSGLPQLPGWQLSVVLKPARETSGDFYDVNLLPNGRLGILIADVVDKGVGAALYMALSYSLFRTYALEHPARPELVLAAVNRRILVDTDTGQFVTVFYGILDPATGELTYSNAGHHPPLVLGSTDGDGLQVLHRTGMALGVLQEAVWEQRTVQLRHGDTLVLYTDGVTDSQNAAGEFFGQARLHAAVQASQGQTAARVQEILVAQVAEFVGEAPQLDDIALVVAVRSAEVPGEED